MNSIELTGKLTKKPEIRYTSTSKAVVVINIYEPDEKTFLDITFWEDKAEEIKELSSDTEIEINGYVRKRSYEDKNHRKIYVTEIIGKSFNIPKESSIEENQHFNNEDIVVDENRQQIGEIKTKEDDPYVDFGNIIELSDDDIAF